MPTKTKAPILVKRYAENRFYETVAGRYLTEADIKEWAARAVWFVVIDSETGKDITHVFLD